MGPQKFFFSFPSVSEFRLRTRLFCHLSIDNPRREINDTETRVNERRVWS